MYTVTFYSFKGGVGRTMALVNVGVELARTGRRVLLVDFDLEAPGIDTFEILKPEVPSPGLVEYVTAYLSTGQAPDFAQYLYGCPSVGAEGGGLWVMPAGRRDQGYEGRLNSIDWADLYASRGGFLVMEDLKEQWQAALKPDYVLIDSRTGHTDVGGICTRQLPDAVVILFFPNDQNLVGLKRVVADIREHSSGGRATTLHFVTANVPDLDDEDRILEQRFKRFRDELGYESLAATIHHYGSLALLNQMIFAVERPRSRLSHEYHELLQAIVKENAEDREGVMAFLREAIPWRYRLPGGPSAGDPKLKLRIEAIRLRHGHDAEVLAGLARLMEEQGDHEQAIGLLTQAIDASPTHSASLRRRGELRLRSGEQGGAVEDARAILISESALLPDLDWSIRLLRLHAPDALANLPSSQVFLSLALAERCELLYPLLWRDTVQIAEEATSTIMREVRGGSDPGEGWQNLSLSLIALGLFEEAKAVIAGASPPGPRQAGAFNYAMADWASTGKPTPALFRKAIDLEPADWRKVGDPNHLQCMAISFWAVGDITAASERGDAALRLIRRVQFPFSAWRYLAVKESEFKDDMEQIHQLIDGQPVLPLFLKNRVPAGGGQAV